MNDVRKDEMLPFQIAMEGLVDDLENIPEEVRTLRLQFTIETKVRL